MPTEEEEPRYTLTTSLTVLEHLSEGLYSKVAAVLTEAVANAWDADATAVDINLDFENDGIEIKDNGTGMSREDINERYLTVGYRKRKEIHNTPRGRAVMGRKGLGKLSLFSIANQIRLETRRKGCDSEALLINVNELKRHNDQNTPQKYHPEPVESQNLEKISPQGTIVQLSELRRERLRETTAEALRRRIARRFSVIGSDGFTVRVDGTEVTPEDREDLRLCQYVWEFIDSDGSPTEGRFKLVNRSSGWPEHWKVRGWIGTVDRPNDLRTPEGSLNSIVVLSRGRLVDEDILPRVSSAEIYTRYLTGQIEADFLDDSGQEDIVTTDRQRLREDDERVQTLLSFVQSRLKDVARNWDELRTTDKKSELFEEYPNLEQWLGKLNKGWRPKAETLLGRIARMELGGTNEQKQRENLLRHAIYGFERLRLRGDAEELERALDQGPDAMLRLLADRDALEAAQYHDIVSSRLDVIRAFEGLTDEDHRERVLQEYLFDHLWLLDPAWDRATGDEGMERRIRLYKPFQRDDGTKQKYGRIDIQYRSVAGKHVLVELKRRSVKPSAGELYDQVRKYVEAFRTAESSGYLEPVIVVGSRIDGAEEVLRPLGAHIYTYDELIRKAWQAYENHLEQARDIDQLERLLDTKTGGH